MLPCGGAQLAYSTSKDSGNISVVDIVHKSHEKKIPPLQWNDSTNNVCADKA